MSHLFDVVEDGKFLIDLFDNLKLCGKINIESLMGTFQVESFADGLVFYNKNHNVYDVCCNGENIVDLLSIHKINKFHLEYI